MKRLIISALAIIGLVLSAIAVQAQEVTLRLHQFLPPHSSIPANALKPWAEKVMAESNGRIKIESYPSMQLGGKPPELYDQVKDGVVDLIWTVIGYTPGRFPKTEAFELPFMVTTAEATSKAFHEYAEKHVMDEFRDVKPIVFHTHGVGLIHTRSPVEKLEDMKGLKIRGGSRVINELLKQLKAVPIGMPVPAVPEALSRGVLDGTTIPWEVSETLKVPELVKNHTIFAGENGLYTLTFIFAMNKASYEKLPADLKAIIDSNSGPEIAASFGRAMDERDKVGKAFAKSLGNKIITLDSAEKARWRKAAEPVIENWVAEMTAKDIDGKLLVDEARTLINKYSN